MKACALAAAHLLFAAQPSAAAGLEEPATLQGGTFAGARIRLSLGGGPNDGKLRAGLALAPTMRSQTLAGQSRTLFGEGVELGFAGERPLSLTLAGRPVGRLLPGATRPEDERRLGMSTTGYIAIGVGIAALVGAFILYQDAKDGSITDCCE
jgi:hypothetical protein